MRRTKIVCTIGPATESEEMIEALAKAGMDVARLNFSHGTLDEHRQRIDRLRAVERRLGKPIAILLDIQGPKIRTGDLADGRLAIQTGEEIYVAPRSGNGRGASAQETLEIAYPPLLDQLESGYTIYLDDGLIELRVEEVENNRARCRVVTGGSLRSRVGVTLPQVEVDLPAIDDNDVQHIRFGVEVGVDFVAASFVRRAEHVEAVRACIREAGGSQHVIAKIESREGVRNIDRIIEAADGVMVARGDLGVDLPSEEVPLVQKKIIEKGNRAGKPVITATQMLDSMARNPRPTRAEVTDVANAIFDGTDAVMLSGETAVGQYPIETVKMMDRIARKSDESLDYDAVFERRRHTTGPTIADAIARSTCESATALGAKVILCSTQSGSSARMVSKYRPRIPIIAVTPHERVVRQLCLAWGVQAAMAPKGSYPIEEMIDVAAKTAQESGLVRDGDLIAIAAGVRTGTPGSTNLLHIHVVGEGSHTAKRS